MSAGLGWFPHVVSGAPRQRGVVASVTASRLGLIEYATIPPAGRVSPVDSTDADASPAGRSLLCLVLPAPRLPQRARSGSRAGMASVIFHTAVISIVISVAAWSRSTPRAPDTAAEPMQLPRLVFLLRPEPGGGGGGGGNRQLTAALTSEGDRAGPAHRASHQACRGPVFTTRQRAASTAGASRSETAGIGNGRDDRSSGGVPIAPALLWTRERWRCRRGNGLWHRTWTWSGHG